MKRMNILGIVVFFIVMLSLYPLSAQVGLKGGINISTLSQKGAELVSISWESAIGFNIGAFYTININQNLAFQPELYYTKKGGKLEGDILSVLASKSLAIHYMELPLLLKLKFPTQGSINPSIFAGPYASLKISDKGEIKILGIELEEEFIKTKDSDFGLVFGGEIGFNVGSTIVILDVRYDLGLANIAEPIIGIENEMRNRSMIIMVGLGF